MDEATIPLNQHGHTSAFQWHAGAWFGALLGASVWMLFGAVYLFLYFSQQIGIVWFSGFVSCAVMTVVLWTQRSQMRAYAAYQWSLFAIGVVGLICLLLAHVAGLLPRLVWNNPNASFGAYAAWLVYPILMLRFHLRERAARAAGQRDV